MAISYIDSSTQDLAGGLSLTLTIPGGATTGDFMVAFVKQSENTSQRIWDDDGGGGNGWTREAYNRTTGGRDQETAIFWKIHTGSESNPTFTWASGITTEPMSGSLLVYRGVDTLEPFTSLTFREAQNDANPPNPAVTITSIPSTVVVFHAATHDDISSVAAPTGYSLRTQVWSGANNDHRNHFTADLIGYNTFGAYTPPDWQHSVLNTTPEYHTYTMALQEIRNIGISGGTGLNNFTYGETGLTLTGFGFGASQSTGKVELWSDSLGTIKTVQTITSWSDTSITFTSVRGSLPNNVSLFITVTNSSSDETIKQTSVGLLPYGTYIESLSPDHYWKLNNDYLDSGITGPTRDLTSGIVSGGGTMVTTPLAGNSTHSWLIDGILVRREIADSPNMNVTISSKERTLSMWLRVNGTQLSLGSVWKEGGGVQNLAFLVGIGNVLMFQLADVAGTRDNVQAVCEIRLTPGRTYHVCGRYSHLDPTKEARIYLDGKIQPLELTDGNPMTLGIFDTHSGDVTFGDPDNNLETGGTDIAYAGQEDTQVAHFATWSDNSANPNSGGLSNTEIYSLFERGALPDYTLTSNTTSNMQASIASIYGTIRDDAPLAIRIEQPTDSTNLELVIDNITFNSRVSLNVQWMGSGTLTWKMENGSSIDETKLSTPLGGDIIVQSRPSITLTGLKDNTEVRILAAGTNTELDGIETVTAGTTDDRFYSFVSTSGLAIDIVIHNLQYKYLRIDNYTVPTDNTTIPIQPIFDRNYRND